MYEIIGIERVDYVSKKTGNPVKGYRVYFTYDFVEGGGGRGKGCDACFCNDSLFAECGIDIGSPAMPVYNRQGRLTGFVESA